MKNILSQYKICSKGQMIKDKFILQIYSGEISASPPIGPIIGQRGINIMEFTKRINSLTIGIQKDIPLRIVVLMLLNKKYLITKINIQTNHFRSKIKNLSQKNQIILISKLNKQYNFSYIKTLNSSFKINMS